MAYSDVIMLNNLFDDMDTRRMGLFCHLYDKMMRFADKLLICEFEDIGDDDDFTRSCLAIAPSFDSWDDLDESFSRAYDAK